MAKRFTDTEKWKKQFIKGLSTVHKLFFLYLMDECDHAGIWHVEFDIAEIRIGEKLDPEEVTNILSKHIIVIDNGEKWFIPYFLEFQYGELNEKVNAHKSVIDKLNKYKLLKKYQQFINPSSRVMDKDKDMDKVKDKKKEILYPQYEEFFNYCKENGFENIAERAFKGYTVAEWHDAGGKKIINWKQKLQNGWFHERNKGTFPVQPPQESFDPRQRMK